MSVDTSEMVDLSGLPATNTPAASPAPWLTAHDDARRATRSHRRRPSRATVVLAIGAVMVWWLSAVSAASILHPPAIVHRGALFVHLASLVLGLGAVLTIDFHGLLWMTGRRRFNEIARLVEALELVIWAGLIGLVVSGTLLEPHLNKPLTRIKIVLVLVVGVNGAVAQLLHEWTSSMHGTMSFRLSPRGYRLGVVASATVSQVAWWGATFIGFLNTTSHH
jgi:hypothetical protein